MDGAPSHSRDLDREKFHVNRLESEAGSLVCPTPQVSSNTCLSTYPTGPEMALPTRSTSYTLDPTTCRAIETLPNIIPGEWEYKEAKLYFCLPVKAWVQVTRQGTTEKRKYALGDLSTGPLTSFTCERMFREAGPIPDYVDRVCEGLAWYLWRRRERCQRRKENIVCGHARDDIYRPNMPVYELRIQQLCASRLDDFAITHFTASHDGYRACRCFDLKAGSTYQGLSKIAPELALPAHPTHDKTDAIGKWEYSSKNMGSFRARSTWIRVIKEGSIEKTEYASGDLSTGPKNGFTCKKMLKKSKPLTGRLFDSLCRRLVLVLWSRQKKCRNKDCVCGLESWALDMDFRDPSQRYWCLRMQAYIKFHDRECACRCFDRPPAYTSARS